MMVDGKVNVGYSFRLWDIGQEYSMAVCWRSRDSKIFNSNRCRNNRRTALSRSEAL